MKTRFAPCLLTAFMALSLPAGAESLVTVYEQALAYDSGLAASRAARDSSREAINESRANLLPQLNAFAESNYTERSTDDDSITTHRYGLRLDQPLFRANAWFGFKAAQEQSKRAEAELSAAQQDLILEVAEQYFNVLRAQDELDTARAQETALRRQWEQAKERYEVGLIATTEVEEARAGYDASQSQRIAAESQLDIEREGLARLSGQYYEDLHKLRVDFPVVIPEPADPQQWTETALMQNWSIQAARLGLDAIEEELKASRSGHLPTLDLSASVTRQHQDGPDPFSPDAGQQAAFDTDDRRTDSSIGLSLNVPLYQGGGTRAQVRRVTSEVERAERELETVRRNVRLQTRSLFRQVNTNRETLKAQQQTIVSRRSALDATRAGYDVGTRNIVEVLDAEQNYFVALRDFANARYDYVLNTLRLRQAAGTLSPQDLFDLDRWLSATAPGIERLARQITEQVNDDGDNGAPVVPTP